MFYNVTTCYVAEKCGRLDFCDSIIDYRNPSKIIFTFKDGTLQTQKNSFVLRQNTIKKCTHSSHSSEEIAEVKSAVEEMSHLLYSWTEGSLNIIPHYKFVEANMGSGYLLKENTPTGYELGKNPPIEQYLEYANLAGINKEEMDLFIGFTNPIPDSLLQNQGLRVQSYVGETSGEIWGVPAVKISASEGIKKENLIPVMIHELTHVFNIGHYCISGIKDVYGIENSEDRGWVEGQPRPHCAVNLHYTNGNPDPKKYFPDSYNWMDPMWNSNPFERYPESNATSYCLMDSSIYPEINPIDSNDNYGDIAGMNKNMKYYKFVYQMHFYPELQNKLFTSGYKKRKCVGTCYIQMMQKCSGKVKIPLVKMKKNKLELK